MKLFSDHCDFEEKWKTQLSRHMKSIYKGIVFPCDQCAYKATWKDNLLHTSDTQVIIIMQVSSSLVINVLSGQHGRENYSHI